MIAEPITISNRFVTPPASVLAGQWRLARFTRSDVLVLLKQGLIPEDASTELLDGMISLKDRAAEGEAITSIGQDHRKTVVALGKLCERIDTPFRHVETQQPLMCREDHVPEPDFMVLRGTLAEYEDIATAADAYCVIEVADSSYPKDSGAKLVDYARAGIAQYIIINLRNRTAEVYTQPDATAGSYAPPLIVTEAETLQLRISSAEMISLRLGDVLP